MRPWLERSSGQALPALLAAILGVPVAAQAIGAFAEGLAGHLRVEAERESLRDRDAALPSDSP